MITARDRNPGWPASVESIVLADPQGRVDLAAMMRMLAPLASICGRRLELPVEMPIGSTLGIAGGDAPIESGVHAALRVCA